MMARNSVYLVLFYMCALAAMTVANTDDLSMSITVDHVEPPRPATSRPGVPPVNPPAVDNRIHQVTNTFTNLTFGTETKTVGILNGTQFRIGTFSIKIKLNNMNADKTKFAIENSLRAISRLRINVATCKDIVDQFAVKYGGFWHCAIAEHLTSYVNYKPNHLILFEVNNDEHVMIFKAREV